MPIIKTEKVADARFVARWKIEEDLESLVKAFDPTTDELNSISSYRNERKKKEWLAGRLTVRHLADQTGVYYTGVSKTTHGKPVLCAGNGEISLTHSYPYVAAILDHGSEDVGIDLEQPTSKLLNISNKFLSASEKTYVENDIHKLCICWCAKESLYKIYSQKGLIFKENLAIDPFETNESGIISGSIIVNNIKKKYKLQYLIEDDYVITYNV